MILLLLVFFLASPPRELSENVRLYWDALQKRDKAKALQFVHPDDLNNFINRGEARFESWELSEIELLSETEAQVKIQLQRFLPNGVVGPVKGRETWVRTEEGWRIRIAPAGIQYRERMAAEPKSKDQEGPASLPSVLDVSPSILNFYALFPRQPRPLYIVNGLDTPVESLEIEINPEKFEILKRPDQLEPRTRGLIQFRYKGEEKGENLKEQLVLRLRQGGETREITVPIVYNYMDPVSRWLRRVEGQKP